jgi:hypothetical protein
MTASTGPLRIGREAYAVTNWWYGSIDDARVYNKALTEAEIQQAMAGDPLQAKAPQPKNGANLDVDAATQLSWSAGAGAARHDVYFGTDRAAVEAANPSAASYKGRQTGTSFPLGGLVKFAGGACFWRIDEVEADGATIHKGNVWGFTVPDYLIVDEFESYTDDDGNRIYQTWVDGWTNKTGAVVGNLLAPFAERVIVHSGKQAMPVDFNNIKSPYYSEVELALAPARNWTSNGVANLSLWLRGYPQKFTQTAPGRYLVSSRSGDISGTTDNFRFVYKQLDGDGSITAKVLSITNTALWAKAGVMVREQLTAGSAHGHMIVTPSGRKAFENRPVANAGSFSSYGPTGQIALPYWVKIERKGALVTAYNSVDGATWTPQPDNEVTGATRSPNPQTINMATSLYIGLLVTSNNTATPCLAEFSDVATTGAVKGEWQIADIGANVGNDAAGVYVAVEDSVGKVAVVAHPDPAAAATAAWTEWKIPLSSFTGVNPAQIKKFYLGVGSRTNPAAGGVGRIFLDDIRVTKP